jgi:hypothetical protein
LHTGDIAFCIDEILAGAFPLNSQFLFFNIEITEAA